MRSSCCSASLLAGFSHIWELLSGPHFTVITTLVPSSLIFENLKISHILMEISLNIDEHSELYMQQKAKLAKYYSFNNLSEIRCHFAVLKI